ncbi:MAG TPA: hypothetical protein VER08_04075 [Pyrinomonadaceae bacterium]|nr:hypothetical protein [Pyrinomonadaceae bacterium]
MRAQGKSFGLFLIGVSIVAALASCGGKRSSSGGGVQAGTVMPPATAARVLSPLPNRPLSPRLEAVREEVMRQTARERGLAWKDEVGMTELTGWEFGTRSKEVADSLGGDDLTALSRLAVAGGILPAGTDLAALAGSFTAAASGAVYSPFDRRVLLLQSEPSASKSESADRSLLTHEFVHALQDQHFGLLKLLLVRPYNFDRTEAAFAVVEGDATNVQRRRDGGEAWSRQPLDEIARQEESRFGAYRRELGALFPPLLTETFVFRYRDGVRFVETVRRARGAGGVDELFRRPPASSEQVLHPEKYLAGEAPREARVDEERFTRRGYRLAASTPLGEIGVRGLVLAGASRAESLRAAAGWGGDTAAVFEREGAPPLFVWQTVWDRPEDAQEFFRAYGALQRRRGATENDARPAPANVSHTLWRTDNLLTLVRLEGDAVLVLRGEEAEINAALEN